MQVLRNCAFRCVDILNCSALSSSSFVHCRTEVAAFCYSLIESAKLAGVAPTTYLRAATETAQRTGAVVLPNHLA